jgi:ligand-binding SRPBCC domain-containing protein
MNIEVNEAAMRSFEISTYLSAPADLVWQHATDMTGVNGELQPLLRMTVPAGLSGASVADLPLGRRVGRSWLLIFGLLPVDFDDLTIAERGPGYRFLEKSVMLTQSCWEHERLIRPLDVGCTITDRLRWQGRVAPLGALYRLAVPVLFRHRHRRLRRRFGPYD